MTSVWGTDTQGPSDPMFTTIVAPLFAKFNHTLQISILFFRLNPFPRYTHLKIYTNFNLNLDLDLDLDLNLIFLQL